MPCRIGSNNRRTNTSLRNGGRCINGFTTNDNVSVIIVWNTLFLLLEDNIPVSGNLLRFRIINPVDMTVVTLVSYEVANPRSSFHFLTLNALFLRDMNICFCIPYSEERKRDVLRGSYIQ
jgi:hypothetical protein